MSTRILVADDETQFLKTVSLVLSLQGYNVDTACDGQEALDKLTASWNQANPYDLLITDIEMPKMTAMDLLEELAERGFQLPIIVISAYGTRPLVRFLLKKGVISYLDKPFAPEVLIERIDLALRNWQAQNRPAVNPNEAAAVQRMACSFAHELNSPLSGVIQCLDLLRIKMDVPEEERATTSGQYETSLHDLLEKAVSSGGRACRIVKNMVALFSPEADQFVFAPIQEAVNQSLEHLREWAEKHPESCYARLNIRQVMASDLTAVRCVAGMLEQVFFNLFKNAAEAMEGVEKPVLQIEVTYGERMLSIRVRDNGKGMSSETLQKIFEPFYSSNTARVTSGLGLWVSQMIVVQKHGGVLNVQSEPGKGTNFTVCLPTNSTILGERVDATH